MLFRKMYLNALCDYCTLSSRKIGLIGKCSYLFAKYCGLLCQKRSINWFGRLYSYDSYFGSAFFQLACDEIERLSRVIDLKSVASVLDVGANVGQWSFALKSYYPEIKVLSFEPCSCSFNLLEHNAKQFQGWTAHNFALGSGSTRKLYFDPEITPSASFYKNKVEQRWHNDICSEDVQVARVEQPCFPVSYDVVKIDVEGAEIEVLENLHVDYRYLYIEVHDNNQERLTSLLKDHREIYRHYPPFEGVVEIMFENSGQNKTLV